MFKILKFIKIQKFLDSDQNDIANKMLTDDRERYYMHPEYLFLMARYLKTTKKFYQAIDCLHASLQHNNDLNFLSKKNYEKSTNELVKEKILLILELSKIAVKAFDLRNLITSKPFDTKYLLIVVN